jgi:hypothetical protein
VITRAASAAKNYLKTSIKFILGHSEESSDISGLWKGSSGWLGAQTKTSGFENILNL